MTLLVAISFFIGVASATQVPQRPVYYKNWRDDPKMVVFGDSTSDVGRRFNAPSSFDFDDIGRFPWVKMFEAPDSDSKFRAYLPAPGSFTNGKVWPSWLRVPEELNFATGSGSASDAFRSRERCTGYIGDWEALPTATLGEQITRYSHDILDNTDDTLDHTHIILVGTNDMNNLLLAASRYNAGGVGYADPVAFENVFEFVDGVPGLTFEPMVRELVGAWQEGITRLIKRGVTGRILLANLPSPRGLPGLEVGLANALDLVALQVRAAAEQISQAFTQVRVLDVYKLSAALVDQPEIFEDLGFTGGLPSGSSLIEPCLVPNFAVDYEADIMGTQADRAAGCQEECALCADGSSPCQNCLEGHPSATVCDNPENYVFWDILHFTTEIHHILGEAIRQCSKDHPKYDRDWVEVLCPAGV